MSLFDRWRTNLGANKPANNIEVPPVASYPRDHQESGSSDEESEEVASHLSHPSTSSSISLKPPAPRPSEESRIVRTGPDTNRRKSLADYNQASGDRRRDEPPEAVRHPYSRHQLLSEDRSLPDLHKTRSNNKFFYHGALSLDQIKNLFWVEEVAPEDHYTQTARALSIFRQKKRHCDVRLTSDNCNFYCHKTVLVTFSQDLQGRLESSSLWKSGKISVDLSSRGFDASTVESVINWMYTGDLHLKNWQNIDKLLKVAEGLKISRLTKVVRKMVPGVIAAASADNKPNISRPETVTLAAPVIRSDTGTFHRSDHHKSSGQSAFCKYTATDDFPLWSFEQVLSLLSKDSISIESEVDVYRAAIRWLNHNRPGRQHHVESLVNCVRWVYLSAEELIDAKHLDPLLFADPTISKKAAMGQWQRDLLRRGIKVPLSGLPVNRVEQAALRKIMLPIQGR